MKKKPITQVDVTAAIKEFRAQGGMVRELPTQKEPMKASLKVDSAYENIFERV